MTSRSARRSRERIRAACRGAASTPLLPDPSQGSTAAFRAAAARMQGLAVRQSGARGRGGRLRAVGRALARRDGDAVVHEPDARSRAIPPRGGRWRWARSAVTAFPRATTSSSARTTPRSASTRSARCSRRCSEFADHATARLVAQLAREALFDPANAEVPAVPVANLSPARRGSAAGSARAARGGARRAAVEARFPARALPAAATVTIEGELTVRLDWDGRRVRKATVRSTRPFAAARVLVGRTPAEAARMVPRLFSICAHAQGAAAAGAVEAATGRTPAAATLAAREAAVVLETIQEYLWRILVDWPRAMGHDAQIEPVAAARRLDRAGARAASRRSRGGPTATQAMRAADDSGRASRRSSRGSSRSHVYGVAPAAWLALGRRRRARRMGGARARRCRRGLLGELRATAPALGRSDVALMPSPRREALLAAGRAGDARASRIRARAACGRARRSRPARSRACMRIRSSRPCWRSTAMRCRRGWWRGSPSSRCSSAGWRRAAAGRAAPPWVDAFPLAERRGPRRRADRARPAAASRSASRRPRRRLPDRRADRVEFPPGGRAGARPRGRSRPRDEAALASDARLAVQALDPCVACRVEVAHA